MIEFWDTFLIYFDENFDCAWASLFLLSGIAIVIILGMTGLLKRHRTWYSILVGINYVYLPVAIMMLCSIFYAFRVMEAGWLVALETNHDEIIATSVEHTQALNEYLSFLHGDTARELSLKEITKEIKTHYEDEYESDLPEDGDFGMLNNAVIPFQRAVGSRMAMAVTSKMASSLADKSPASAQSWQHAWQQATEPAVKEGLSVDVIREMIDKLMKIVRPQLYKWAACALCPSFLEILIYALYSRRRRRLAAA